MVSNFLKKHEWKIKAYFLSPFICWGIAFEIIREFGDYFIPLDQFRTLLWGNYFHWAFFIPVIFLTTTITYYPYISGFKYLIWKKRQISSIILLSTIIVALMAEAVMYYIGIVSLIGYTFKEAIIDLDYFRLTLFYSAIVTFFGIPIIFIFTKRNIRNTFSKEQLSYDRINWGILISIIWLLFIVLLVTLWILNLFVWHSLPLQNEI